MGWVTARALVCAGVVAAALQGCYGMWPPAMIDRDDQVGLMKYYEYEAKDLRGQAGTWEAWAKAYEQRAAAPGTPEALPYAAHCRAVAGYYRKAADEVEALAREHRAMLPQDVVQ